MNVKLQKLCNTALGIALFVVLSLCIRVPVFENYYICLGYVVMAVYCYSFGTASGTLVGILGVVLYCVLTSGLRGMPGWASGNLVIGIVLGVTFRITKRIKNSSAGLIIDFVAIVVAVAIGILGVKSIVEAAIYTQPFLLRVTKNSYAFIADVVTLIVSLPICVTMDKYLHRLK